MESWLCFSFQPEIVQYLRPEVELLLRTALWNFSIRLNAATFGQQLLFICYDKAHLLSKRTLSLHFLLDVFLVYLRDNATSRFTSVQMLQRTVSFCENSIALLNVINYFRFLKVGKKPSLIDYVLNLDNISMYGNRRREIGYSHMTRELIWGGFMVRMNTAHFTTAPFCNVFRNRSCWPFHCRWSTITTWEGN